MPATSLSFAKMHGCGNDYVVLDAWEAAPADPAALARALCDRRRGVGADGLLLALPSEGADLRMRMFNPDGSEAEMCGNGLRCLVRFAQRAGRVAPAARLRVRTGAGVLAVTAPADGDLSVDMGVPGLERAALPMEGPPGRVLDEPFEAAGQRVRLTAVSMGNPHVVVFVPDVAAAPVATLGPAVSEAPAFPRRTNVAFVEVLAADRMRQRTWERGAGETQACGTGACAAVVAAALTGRAGREATVHLAGGDLRVRWDDDDHVHLSGPAVHVFTGTWPLEA